MELGQKPCWAVLARIGAAAKHKYQDEAEQCNLVYDAKIHG